MRETERKRYLRVCLSKRRTARSKYMCLTAAQYAAVRNSAASAVGNPVRVQLFGRQCVLPRFLIEPLGAYAAKSSPGSLPSNRDGFERKARKGSRKSLAFVGRRRNQRKSAALSLDKASGAAGFDAQTWFQNRKPGGKTVWAPIGRLCPKLNLI